MKGLKRTTLGKYYNLQIDFLFFRKQHLNNISKYNTNNKIVVASIIKCLSNKKIKAHTKGKDIKLIFIYYNKIDLRTKKSK